MPHTNASNPFLELVQTNSAPAEPPSLPLIPHHWFLQVVWALFLILIISAGALFTIDPWLFTWNSAVTTPVQQTKLIVLAGEVSVNAEKITQSRILKAGDKIKTGSGSKALISFFDDSVSRLKENTELEIKTLDINPNNQTETKVLLKLNFGEVWNKVSRLVSQNAFFEIGTYNTTAAVRGTSFDLQVDPKTQQTKVLVLEHAVNLTAFDPQTGGLLAATNLLEGQKTVIKPFVPLDSDQDGLSDQEELWWGTNPADPDSDADGYLDGDEIKNGYNPLGTGKLTQPAPTQSAPAQKRIKRVARQVDPQKIFITESISKAEKQSAWLKENVELDFQYEHNFQQKTAAQNKKLAGILPDSPFYALKQTKDKFLLQASSDNAFGQVLAQIRILNRKLAETALLLEQKKSANAEALLAEIKNLIQQNTLKIEQNNFSAEQKQQIQEQWQAVLDFQQKILSQTLPGAPTYELKQFTYHTEINTTTNQNQKLLLENEYKKQVALDILDLTKTSRDQKAINQSLAEYKTQFADQGHGSAELSDQIINLAEDYLLKNLQQPLNDSESLHSAQTAFQNKLTQEALTVCTAAHWELVSRGECVNGSRALKWQRNSEVCNPQLPDSFTPAETEICTIDLCQNMDLSDHCEGTTFVSEGVCRDGKVNFKREANAAQCGYLGECQTKDWQTSAWSLCNANGFSMRNVGLNPTGNCKGETNKPSSEIKCKAEQGTDLTFKDKDCVSLGNKYQNPDGKWSEYFGDFYNDASRTCTTLNKLSGTQICQNGAYADCMPIGQCPTGYHWNQTNAKCDADQQTFNCNFSPSVPLASTNAHWNNLGNMAVNMDGTFTSKWNGYQYKPTLAECSWSCDNNYHQTANQCEADTQTASCENKPGNSTWIAPSSVDPQTGVFVQTWQNGAYQPSLSTCAWQCNAGYQDNDHNQTCAPTCSNDYCLNQWQCNDQSGQRVCACSPGWTGATCADAVSLPAPTCQIQTDQAIIHQGEKATLTWTSANASSATLLPSVGAVALNGAQEVSPSATLIYILKISNFNAEASCQITITVNTNEEPTYAWKTGVYSACQTPGSACQNGALIGSKTKDVWCEDSNGQKVSDDKCPASAKPAGTEICSLSCYWTDGSDIPPKTQDSYCKYGAEIKATANVCQKISQCDSVAQSYANYDHYTDCLNGKCDGSWKCIPNDQAQTSTLTYDWKYGDYSACQTAGSACQNGTMSGVKTREVWCEDSNGQKVDDAKCPLQKPETTKTCSASCYWIYGDNSNASVSKYCKYGSTVKATAGICQKISQCDAQGQSTASFATGTSCVYGTINGHCENSQCVANTKIASCWTVKPSNSFWNAPSGVDPATGAFTQTWLDQSYQPDVSACAWQCNVGYQDNDHNQTCELSCTSDYCNGHGACSDTSGQRVCACYTGWTGTQCETQISPTWHQLWITNYTSKPDLTTIKGGTQIQLSWQTNPGTKDSLRFYTTKKYYDQNHINQLIHPEDHDNDNSDYDYTVLTAPTWSNYFTPAQLTYYYVIIVNENGNLVSYDFVTIFVN